ncbi:hypothetical protein SDC9_180644 [bioreactor metagenome]|uniref:Uncharacterized protein n=1 Tax=bioreactor metagenome TaxID=1076179 RepID=A0A645H389_9ZZZZ
MLPNLVGKILQIKGTVPVGKHRLMIVGPSIAV